MEGLKSNQRETYPTGFAVKNIYNTRSNLLEVRDAANDAVFWSAGNQNARGQATLFRLGNGLSTVKSFDAEGHPTLITTGFGTASAIQHQSFVYDVHGNLKTRTDFNQRTPDGVGNLVETFTYDALFRLKTALLTGSGCATTATTRWVISPARAGWATTHTYGNSITGATQAGPHAVRTGGYDHTSSICSQCCSIGRASDSR